MKLPALDPRILQAEAVAHEANDCVAQIIEAVQVACGHFDVGEAAAKPSDSGLFAPMPPFRVCLLCGYAERPNHTGQFDRLETSDRLAQIPREVAYFRSRRSIRED